MSRTVKMGATALAGLICGGLVASQLVAAGDSSERPNLSVLGTPAGPDDKLPPAARTSPSAGDFEDVDAARYVGNYAGANYFLVPGTRGRLCLIDIRENTVGVVCVPAKQLSTGLWAGSVTPSGKRVVAVVAPDGYSSGTVVSRRGRTSKLTFGRNVAFATLTNASDVILTGPGRATIDLTVPAPPKMATGRARR